MSGRKGFDSKWEFIPPIVLLGLLLCPWMWGISLQPFQCLPSCWVDMGYDIFLTLDMGYLFTAAPATQAPLLTLDMGYLLLATRCSSAARPPLVAPAHIGDVKQLTEGKASKHIEQKSCSQRAEPGTARWTTQGPPLSAEMDKRLLLSRVKVVLDHSFKCALKCSFS